MRAGDLDPVPRIAVVHAEHGIVEAVDVPRVENDLLAGKASVVATNVPGPQQQLYMAGSPLREMMFWVPQTGAVGVGISILSYRGRVHFGVIADARLIPDPEAVVRRFRAEFDTFLYLALMGSWDSPLVLDNLKTGKLAQVARSTNTSVYNTQFRFDLAANYVLRALALVNHNLTTSAKWRARTTEATLDMDFVGPTHMRPRTVTYSGGANGTRVGIYGSIEAATCPRYDYSPVNRASGTATQTISSVPAGTYLLITTGSNAAVMATGSTVSNSGTIGTTTYPSFVVVTATGDVTLTVLSAATAIHFRESLGLLWKRRGPTNPCIAKTCQTQSGRRFDLLYPRM